MHFSTFTATAPVSFMAMLAHANPVLLERQNGVICQTSSGSPTTGDVTDVINQVRGKGENGEICSQDNGAGSGKTSCSPLGIFQQAKHRH